jgi:hypothetical protein
MCSVTIGGVRSSPIFEWKEATTRLSILSALSTCARALESVALPFLLAFFLGVKEFGIWASLFSVLKLFPVVDMGVSSWSVTAQAAHGGKLRRVIGTEASRHIGIRLAWLLPLALVACYHLPTFRSDQFGGTLFAPVIVATLATAVASCANPLHSMLLFEGLGNFGFTIRTTVLRIITVVFVASLSLRFSVVACIYGWSFLTLVSNLFFFLSYYSRSNTAGSEQKSAYRNEASNFSRGSVIWTVAGILISGLDVPFVAFFDPNHIPFIFTGINSAIGASLPAIVAKEIGLSKNPSNSIYAVSRLLSRVVSFVSVLIAVALFSLQTYDRFGRGIVSNEYDSFFKICPVLICAAMIRAIGVPATSAMLGSHEHLLIRTPPIIESVASVTLSCLLGFKFGAIGVAFGTLGSSALSSVAAVQVTLRRATMLRLDRVEYLSKWRKMLWPLVTVVTLGLIMQWY